MLGLMKRESPFPRRPLAASGYFKAWLLLALLALLATSVSGQNLNARELSAALDRLTGSSLVRGASVGVAFFSPADSSLIYGHRETSNLIPASLQKLYTGIGALSVFGPEHRFETLIGSGGEIVDGVLQGDLVVRGSGDPTWMDDFYPEGPHEVFELWADSLGALGIRRVSGNLIGDISLYPTIPYNSHWEAHNLPYGFSPAVGAISFNANLVRFDLQGSSRAGNRARASARHGYGYFNLNNQIRTVSTRGTAAIWLEVSRNNRGVTLKGELGVNTPEYLTAAVRNPPQFALQVMKETLARKGIAISGNIILKEEATDSLRTLFSFPSPPLGQILRVMLKNSSNMIAETLLCDIGLSPENGAARVEGILSDKGLPAQGIHITDGSGLARQNRCSASHLGLTLCHAWHQDWFQLFLDSLAKPGEDGTLKRRFAHLEDKSILNGKTGTLRDVSNLAGYLRAADGRLYAFVIICNNVSSIANAKKWQESICDKLLRYSGQ